MTEGRIRESSERESGQRVRYDRTEGEPPSIAVATALARYYDEDVTASNVRLYDYVDPEALDALFTDAGSDRPAARLEFVVEDALVAVGPDRIEVMPTN
ncbi:HalOD1 output domain-containing protein [Halopiger goleimassiliensis]|uniref:HalOD1 output domain-containing protein n=1 Tax=Halopiger goleimassiliensis TaxID=1293048 RepID=UPI000677CF86|nr:HalOD1 output domain-containing protein [Halopiger goleimassiliensis]